MHLQIDNEYDKLEAVLVHRPGREIDRLTHDNMREFLFADIPYLRRMQDEHDAFVAAMRDHGTTVYYLEALLQEVLEDDDVRQELIDLICRSEAVPAIAQDLADRRHWNADALVELLFSGVTTHEYADATGRRVAGAAQDGESFLLSPIPNAYFCRDPAVVMHDAVISSKMHYRERVRETLLTRAVLENHPEFRDATIAYGGSDEPTEDRPFTIEGGDVIILSPDAVLVGCSERTRSETIERLAAKCFQVGHVKRVYEVKIPSERAFMHLDTVFTVVDRGVVLWYSEVMKQISCIHRYEADGDRARRIPDERGFVDILRDEFDRDVTIIDTAGGEKPFDTREQRMDGANALAIAPGVVFTYQRNERTARALESQEVTCIEIEGSELVRGLGGARCMTMPLRRTPGPA